MPTSSQRARFSVTDRPVTVLLTIQAFNTRDRDSYRNDASPQ